MISCACYAWDPELFSEKITGKHKLLCFFLSGIIFSCCSLGGEGRPSGTANKMITVSDTCLRTPWVISWGSIIIMVWAHFLRGKKSFLIPRQIFPPFPSILEDVERKEELSEFGRVKLTN